MGADYFPALPLIILVLGGMTIMILEPFTAPQRKSRMGQIAIFTCFLAFLATYTLRIRYRRQDDPGVWRDVCPG